MNKFNIGNYKLPHMAPFKVKKVANRIEQQFDRTPKRLDVKKPVELKQTVSSSGDNDSIAMSNAWQKFNKAYLDNPGKETLQRNESGKYEKVFKPTTMDQRIEELNREGGEFYLQKQDDGTFKPKLIPTDDAERPDQNFLSTLQPGQLFKPMEGFTPSVSLPENE
jgi:hypothetical protein